MRPAMPYHLPAAPLAMLCALPARGFAAGVAGRIAGTEKIEPVRGKDGLQ